jgi:hypothetical protein
MSDEIYTIFCDFNDDKGDPFPVEVAASITIGELKNVIAKLAPNRMKDIAPKSINLYQIDVQDPDTQESQETRKAAIEKKMRELDEKLDVFSQLFEIYPSEPPKSTTHILIQLPSKHIASIAALQSIADHDSRLHRRSPG